MDKDTRKAVHGEMKKGNGIFKVSERKEKDLEKMALIGVCSGCGKTTHYRNKNGNFIPAQCPFCLRTVINIYASEQTGVLTTWVE